MIESENNTSRGFDPSIHLVVRIQSPIASFEATALNFVLLHLQFILYSCCCLFLNSYKQHSSRGSMLCTYLPNKYIGCMYFYFLATYEYIYIKYIIVVTKASIELNMLRNSASTYCIYICIYVLHIHNSYICKTQNSALVRRV